MASRTPPAKAVPSRKDAAFTLLELLVVLGIVTVLMAFLAPAFTTIKAATDLTTATSGIAGTLERARTYAMSNNLYVYVGIAEVNASVSADAVPQTPASSTTGGRVAVATVVMHDGTRGYDLVSNLSDPAWANGNQGAGLLPVENLEVYENVHLPGSLGTLPTNGPMARPAVDGADSFGNTACKSVTPFSWPLGTKPGSGKYYFEKVIQFDPQGVARIQYATNQDRIAGWMEIALQQTHGSMIPAAPAAPVGAIAAIQVDGMTGTVRIFRP